MGPLMKWAIIAALNAPAMYVLNGLNEIMGGMFYLLFFGKCTASSIE